jgi:hypothetical protein
LWIVIKTKFCRFITHLTVFDATILNVDARWKPQRFNKTIHYTIFQSCKTTINAPLESSHRHHPQPFPNWAKAVHSCLLEPFGKMHHQTNSQLLPLKSALLGCYNTSIWNVMSWK